MNNQNCGRTLCRVQTFFSAFGTVVSKKLQKPFTFTLLLLMPLSLLAQAVTAVVTDYNGYWKSSTTAPNSSKPLRSHNLLAFTYNGIQYSTGVNDELLHTKDETFTAADFWCLPVGSITGTLTGQTKIGLGALFDGVANGGSNPPPENDMVRYLTDGIKGLDIGTCVANLPVGALNFYVHSINATEIGDGKPDILVTQVADPSGDFFDRYEFTDSHGNRVGNYKDIQFTKINPVGTWVGDFYEASQYPMTLVHPYIHTNRPMRLWAADLSEFGINSTNIHLVRNFKINLCGNSDVAFVAYNRNGMGIGVLPVQLLQFKAVDAGAQVQLSWQTGIERENNHFILERSADGRQFAPIGTIKGAGNSSRTNDYSFTDKQPLSGVNYYRLKQVDDNGAFAYSGVLQVKRGSAAQLQVYPNPGKGVFYVSHPPAAAPQRLLVYNAYGALVGFKAVPAGAQQTPINLGHLPSGAYYLQWQHRGATQTASVSVQ